MIVEMVEFVGSSVEPGVRDHGEHIQRLRERVQRLAHSCARAVVRFASTSYVTVRVASHGMKC